MNKTRIAYLGTKEIGYECLKYLIAQQDYLNLKVCYVASNNRSLNNSQKSVAQLATENSIPILDSPDELLDKDFDVLLSVQYHLILKQHHIDKAKNIAINLHMAPLPEYRGCNQFSFALIDQKIEFGTTLHKMEAGIDNGDVLFEKRFAIPKNCFVKDLYDLTFEMSLELFRESIGKIIEGDYSLTPQVELEKERGKSSLHYRNEMEGIKTISGDWPFEKQKRYFRATYFPPFPPPYKIENEQKVELSMDWYNSL